MKLKFIFAATADLSSAIDFFEEQRIHVHNAREKMEEILTCQLRKCVKEEYINNMDQESEEITKKCGRELLEIVVDDDSLLSNKKLFIGFEVEKELKQFGLKPTSPQIEWLFDMARNFHLTVIQYLVKYFDTALKNSRMDNMSGLSPYKQSHVLTSTKIKALANQYSKVVDNIQTIGGMDELRSEIDNYVVDDDVKNIEKNQGFEEYWNDVAAITDGDAAWQRYTILPRFAKAMGVKHNDTSDVERQFSVMNNIHQNKQRNSMSHDTLDSHLQIR